ncbi:MAG: HAMP domain-containing histidine kinase [Deltaproteobacteria bacterium]|nr:HAMP domain-containing histidine kinase [Deltaproteobacteria bacterium]
MTREPVRLETPRRLASPWVYALVGALSGAAFEIIICDPLDIVLQQVIFWFLHGIPVNLSQVREIYTSKQWPGIALTGILYGSVLGFVIYGIRESRRRFEALHHEFELQVATLRHHYKNLAIGIQGFSRRLKHKLSHLEAQLDLNSPLCAPFRSECEALQNDVAVLEDAAQRLTHTLAEELLFLKALTSDTLHPTPKDFFPELVRAIQELKALRFGDKPLRIDINGQPLEADHGSLVFPFEPYTMQVILQNILSNAMKYGDHIQVEVKEGRAWVQVAVRDNGPGLEMQQIKRLILTPQERRGDSTHLGLQVTLHLLEKYGGRLSVWSQPGAGAKFYLEFPKKPRSAHE